LLVATALLGGVALTFIAVLSTGSLAAREHGEETIAQQLALTQQETIEAAAYDATGASYSPVDTPSDYSIDISVNSTLYANNNIQVVTVTVLHDGNSVLIMDSYKVNR